MSMTIRIGAVSDASALAELAARTFRDTFGADNRPEDLALYLERAYGTSQQHRELVDPDIVTLLVEMEGELAGYAQLRSGAAPPCVTAEAPIELWRFYVVQAWHGRGIAQALMRRVEAEARRRGARTLWLGVWERNERAKAFYQKVGFVDVGSHVFMVGTDAQTDRILIRPLPPARATRLRAATPMIHVPDVQATAAWYAAIGFSVIETYDNGADGLSFAILAAGDTRIMFNQGGRPSAERRREVDLYVDVDAVDQLFATLRDRVEVVEPPHDTHYGMREFIIRDLNRFWITFGQNIPGR